MRRALFTLLFLIVCAPFVWTDGVTVVASKAWESVVDTQAGHFFSLDSTYEGMCYIELEAFDQSDGALVRLRKFNKSTKTWETNVTEIYSVAAGGTADPNSFVCRVIGTKVHILMTRRLNGTFRDVVHFNSTDLTMSAWTTPEVIYTFVGGRKGNVHGEMIYIEERDTYMVAFYSHDGVQTAGGWRVGYFTSTNEGVSWTLDETAIYGPTDGSTKWGELVIANTAGCNLVALLRNQTGNSKVGQSTSIDCGENWTNPDLDHTNMGISVGIKIPAIYYDENIDRLFAIIHDRALNSSGGNRTFLYIASPANVFADPDNWGSVVITLDNYFAAGYPTMDKIDSDEYIMAWFREDIEPNSVSNRNINDLDVRYLIYQIDQGSPPTDPTCPPDCPPPTVQTNAGYGGVEVRGLTLA